MTFDIKNMLNIKTLIVDDEPPAIEELYYHCSQYIDQQNIYEIDNPKQALDAIKDYHIDLAFLDINMPFISGIELAEKIAELDKPPYIVFVTAYDEYALQAFELNAIDYVLKPIDPKRFDQTIKKIKTNIKCENGSSITKESIKKATNFISGKITAVGTNPNDRYIFNLSDITHFQADGPIVFASKLDGDQKRVHYQLQELEKALPKNFVRCHKSYIVNIEHVARMYLWQKSNFQIELENGEKIPVSRRYSQAVKEQLNW